METGEKEKELGIDVLRVYMVFYIKSHGNLCAGFLFAVYGHLAGSVVFHAGIIEKGGGVCFRVLFRI